MAIVPTDSLEVGHALSKEGKCGVYIALTFNDVEVAEHGFHPDTARKIASQLCSLADKADKHNSGEALIDFDAEHEEPEASHDAPFGEPRADPKEGDPE